jgi:meso-butanediol dehydrogenase/(S,S)-butanediol dehydrogenase/diacetyl reductase
LANIAVDLPKELMLAHMSDVSDSEAGDAMVETVVKRFGRLDVLVNNAGIFQGGDPAEITNEQWRKVMSTDADGVFYGCRAALPHLEKTKGGSSTPLRYGIGGNWGMSPYNAAKGAIVNLTRPLALDLGKKGVRTNSVCPSLTPEPE